MLSLSKLMLSLSKYEGRAAMLQLIGSSVLGRVTGSLEERIIDPLLSILIQSPIWASTALVSTLPGSANSPHASKWLQPGSAMWSTGTPCPSSASI